ncbi:amidase [Pseudonocardia alaniniphila]|uniref:Amidase n=1 Tax=Pseudonocardia alaniniphila TaxID=75291 RepID=A0ABS9TB58_9PSEU|nr:amidase [Pseudonocardia alaniniphila]MCH6165742.1 amidase [Pseudonocardia alaniniphila]
MVVQGDLVALTAAEAARRIRAGSLTSVQLVTACLERIQERDPDLAAWVDVDAESALAEAAVRDAAAPQGALHGVPVGIKDNADAVPFFTRFGSPIYRNNKRCRDAAHVAKLRAAGAVILGKTVTTEFATFPPGPTRNPRAPGRTPGGSSSGSAAALADHHVPLATGSQTVSSLVRPAAFCGVYAWKASFGRLPLEGVLATSATLDTLGFLARSVDDFLLLHEIFLGELPRPPARTSLRIGLHAGPTSNDWHPEMQGLLARAGETLRQAGMSVVDVDPMPFSVDAGIERHWQIMTHEIAALLAPRIQGEESQVTAALLDMLEEGRRVSRATYVEAMEGRESDRAALAGMWADCDLLLTPAALGPATPGLDSTGDPLCGRLWSYLAVPSIACPMGATEADRLPLGLQTIGPEGQDGATMLATKIIADIVGSPFAP